MNPLRLVLVLCWVLTGCSQVRPSVPSEFPQTMKPHIAIFIPGFKGSILRQERDGRVAWVTAYDAFINGKSLAYDISELAIRKPGPHLKSDGVLQQVPAFFGAYSFDVYGSTLSKIQETLAADIQLLPFDYDWRGDIVEDAREFARFVQRCKQHGATDITIIAHSMGGLVAAYYLQYGDQPLESAIRNWSGAGEISRVIFAATPFRGALTIFNDMQQGIQTFLNSSLLSSEALSTFPASYQLLPGAAFETFLTPDLKPNSSMHDGTRWENYGWGLLKDSKELSPRVKTARTAYTANQLARAELFSRKINAHTANELSVPIPVLNLIGEGHETMARAIFDTKNGTTIFTASELKAQYPNIPRSAILHDGDGVVPGESALLSEVFTASKTTEVSFSADHGSVISSGDAAQIIREFIQKNS